MRPITIVHVCETAKGGVGTYINLFATFDPAQFRSVVVAPKDHVAHLDQSLDIRSFPRPSRGIGATLNMIRTGQRVVAEIKPDVIFCHSAFSLSAVAWFRITSPNSQVLYCPHGLASSRYEEGSLKKRVCTFVEAKVCALPSLVIHVSRHEMQLCCDRGYRGRHEAVENALPDAEGSARDDMFARTRQSETRPVNLIFVGRLDRQKGFDLLIEAMRRIESDRSDIVLHVVGESVNGDASLGRLSSNIEMHGWIDNRKIDSWYRSADAVIIPSRWEGLPFVIVEALRNGTPVLVSERSGMPQLVEQGITGEVFDLDADSITAVLRLLDADTLRAMRPACRQSYERRFAIERYRKEFSGLLSKMAEQPSDMVAVRRCS